jgi:preprotein translocase subunit YajC
VKKLKKLPIIVVLLLLALIAVLSVPQGFKVTQLEEVLDSIQGGTRVTGSTVTVTKTEVKTITQKIFIGSTEQKIIEVYEKVRDSVVLVTALSRRTVLTIYGPTVEWSRSEGSGFFIDYGGGYTWLLTTTWYQRPKGYR